MMGGNANVWKSGAGKPSGLINPSNKRAYSHLELGLNEPQIHNDDKVEINIISNMVNLSLGKGSRIGQEKGPLIIHFKQGQKRALVTYMQIDGEYYRLVNPQKIEVSLADRFGHMRILKNIE